MPITSRIGSLDDAHAVVSLGATRLAVASCDTGVARATPWTYGQWNGDHTLAIPSRYAPARLAAQLTGQCQEHASRARCCSA